MEIIRFPDPFQRCAEYLHRATGHPADLALPDDYTEISGVFLVVRDTGGPGQYGIALEEARLTVEVWAPTQEEASEVARTVFGLLRAWPQHDGRVRWRGVVGRPQFYPDETRIPRYVLTVALAFRGEADHLPVYP